MMIGFSGRKVYFTRSVTRSIFKSCSFHSTSISRARKPIDLLNQHKLGASQGKHNNKIVNVSHPIPISTTQETQTENNQNRSIKILHDIQTDITKLESSISKTHQQLEGVLDLLSNQKPSNTKLVQELKDRVKQVEAEKQKDAQQLKALEEEKQSVEIKVKELEKLIVTSQTTRKQEAEEHFREFRAYETSLKEKGPFSDNKFFTPVNSGLVTSTVKRGSFPSLVEEKDTLFFPSLSPSSQGIHEFMIVTNDKAEVLKTNPLEANYHRPDLFTLMENLGSSKNKYWDIVHQHEKNHWKLIAIKNTFNDKVMVFERFVTPEDLKQIERTKKLEKYLGPLMPLIPHFKRLIRNYKPLVYTSLGVILLAFMAEALTLLGALVSKT